VGHSGAFVPRRVRILVQGIHSDAAVLQGMAWVATQTHPCFVRWDAVPELEAAQVGAKDLAGAGGQAQCLSRPGGEAQNHSLPAAGVTMHLA